ncbi:DEAD/DEAH box helicase, partial [Salmonella enterica subsp. enterica serovar Typhimurium]
TFAAGFPFEETPDQQAAIDAVREDLLSAKPMDRLVCGDVGFGKTEVAMRAAFIAVHGGKQVAVLVPTTLLAQQHYNSFR